MRSVTWNRDLTKLKLLIRHRPFHRARKSFKIRSMVATVNKSSKRKLDEHYEHDSDATQERERLCGISAFVTSSDNVWRGYIKERYSDFIVNEISVDGNVQYLEQTNADHLKDFFKLQPQQGEEELSHEAKIARLAELVGSESAAKVELALKSQDVVLEPVVCSQVNTREARTVVHWFLKVQFPGMLLSSTSDDGSLVISRKGKHSKEKDNRSISWKDKGVSCCRFVLNKENRDTMDAISYVSRNTKIPVKVFGYAGTKDKRASTSQLVTAYKVYAERLAQFNNLSYAGITLGNFCYVAEPLQLGDLAGNRFSICVRDISGDDLSPKVLRSAIVSRLQSVRSHGFINYFGLQRFGTRDVKTSQVGAALLESDWKRAVDLILGNFEAGAGLVWRDTGNAAEALKSLGTRKIAERYILQHLAKENCESDFATAVAAIPRNMRTMYVRAFQSLIWNSVASERIKRYGALKPIIGDLVAANEFQEQEESDSDAKAALAERGSVGSKKNLARPLMTEEDVSRHTIFDVVLPLPGFDVLYPQNDLYNVYKELLLQSNVDIDSMKRSIRDYSLPGAYRRLIGTAKDLEWEFKAYSNADDDLILTDRAKLAASNPTKCDESSARLALVLNFSLKTSQYATMLLREISGGMVTQRTLARRNDNSLSAPRVATTPSA